MKIGFYKTGEVNASSYLKNPLRSNAIINIENKLDNLSIILFERNFVKMETIGSKNEFLLRLVKLIQIELLT